jgi:hypothetical protein
MAVSGQARIKAPAGAGRLHGHQLSSSCDVEIRLPARVGGLARAVCLGPRASRRRRVVLRDGDLSCDAKTCRARRSCEAETCHARRRLVGEIATQVKIGCLVGAGS